MNNFYTYAYLREDGTPYYIGKGRGKRIYQNNHNVSVPPKERRLILKQNLTEEEAFKHEIYMISVIGRKNIGTGILRNLTDGGEGGSGAIRSNEYRERVRKQMLNMPQKQRDHLRQLSLNMSQEQRDKISLSLKGRVSAKREKYLITYRNGKTEVIIGLDPFCRERGYSVGNIYSLIQGKRKKHKDIVAVEKLDTTP
jgi:hypothetical protein